jgi:hypothetical protein
MDLCAFQGVRSLSDHARDAIQNPLETPVHNGNGHATAKTQTDLLQLRGRMAKLEGEVERLSRMEQS